MNIFVKSFLLALRDGLLAFAAFLIAAYVLNDLLAPALAALQVTENVTIIFAGILLTVLPVGAYTASAARLRQLRAVNLWLTAGLALGAAAVLFLTLILAQSVATGGTTATRPSLGITTIQTAEGILIEEITPGGAAEIAGLQAGDVITALRRSVIDKETLDKTVSESDEGDALRLRFLRNGEEMQLTINVQFVEDLRPPDLLPGAGIAVAMTLIVLFIPAAWIPHLLLMTTLAPLVAGYVWLIVASFSQRTHGLFPVDAQGNFGGWTMDNWGFLGGRTTTGLTVNLWQITLNSLLIAVILTVLSLIISSMTGYALSRMNFPGRRAFLSLTLILHGFPAVTLIIPIFLVLINIASIPIIGRWFGFNTPGGIALVMVAFELPLGVWLMKGFFDHISWDMERSALIDGASRWRTFREIILPQIRPGLLALGIFSFIGGWNAYLIPATYSIGTGTANLPVFINQLTGELTPVNWNQVAAVGLFQLLPIFVFFIIAQEYLLNIYAGGTKGST
jgi:inositol-phosphate transport system permease protein